MKRLSFLMCAVWMTTALFAGTVNYTADNSTIFANPERGFYTELDHVVTKKNPYCVKGREEELRKYYITKDKKSLLLVLYYLDNFKNTATIPQEVLNGFDEDMQTLRDMGLKAILRYAYTSDDTGEIGYDAPLSIVEKHIDQYKSHWEANADVIFCFQAGFIGSWGEWYYTDHFGNKESRMNDSRRALVDTLLAATPSNRFIQLRTPIFKTDYVGDTKALTAGEAYQNTPRARLGHHNDAFLYGPDNMGTYKDTATQKPYIAQETLYVPIGGETDITDSEQAKTDASYSRTVSEMSRLHWTFLQGEYSQTVTDMWRNDGTFDELNRRMGYRFQLVSGTYSEQVAQEAKLALNLQIKNTGFAPLYNERHAYLVLKNDAGTYSLPIDSDPRSWLPNGVVTTIDEQITVPATVPVGTYQLYLHLPDVYASIASDPRYAVRFANSGVWDEETGMNALNASVEVTAKSVDPDPDPDPDPITPGDAILLPATLNKANVNAYSDDMSWYNTDYFDFGPEDALNTDRWAEWKVELRYPGKYIVSIEGYYPNGHQWQLSLAESGVSPYQLPASWAAGEIKEEGTESWNLSALSKGTYTLRAQNIMEWGRPKMKSITLAYDGEIPTDIESAETPDTKAAKKVLINQTLYILQGDKIYTTTGQEVK